MQNNIRCPRQRDECVSCGPRQCQILNWLRDDDEGLRDGAGLPLGCTPNTLVVVVSGPRNNGGRWSFVTTYSCQRVGGLHRSQKPRGGVFRSNILFKGVKSGLELDCMISLICFSLADGFAVVSCSTEHEKRASTADGWFVLEEQVGRVKVATRVEPKSCQQT